MSTSRANERTPLFNFTTKEDLTSNTVEIIEISSECAIASQPLDIINRIAKEFKGDYQSLAKLSQTSKIMKKLIEQTEDGQKAAKIQGLSPNAVSEWLADSNSVNIDSVTMYAGMSGFLISGCSIATIMLTFLGNSTPGAIVSAAVSVPGSVVGGLISGGVFHKGLHANRNHVQACRAEIENVKKELVPYSLRPGRSVL